MEKIMKSTKLVHKILGILFWVVVAVSAVFVFFPFGRCWLWTEQRYSRALP